MRVGAAALRGAPTPVQPNMAGACAECNANQGGRRLEAKSVPVRDVSRLKLSDVLFWVIAGMSAVLLVVLALILSGVIPIDRASDSTGAPPDPLERQPTTAPEGVTTAPVITSAATAPRAPKPTVVVIAAVRGDSWFSARVGSESGRVLDERVLAQGESVRVQARRIWLSVGAAANVEVTVDGTRTALSPGTVSVVLPEDATSTANAAR